MLLNAAMVGAFERWTEMAEEAKEMRVKLKRAVMKITMRQVAGAFNNWRTKTAAAVALKVGRCRLTIPNPP